MPVNYRITTNGTLRTYSSNLTGARKTLNDAMIKVQTHRAFQSYAENPTAAAKCWHLRRSMERASDQFSNTGAVFGKFAVGYTAMASIADKDQVNGVAIVAKKKVQEALTDTTASGRIAEGQALLNYADTMITTVNGAKYGLDFVFNGADALNCPFEWELDAAGQKTGNLLYRGINVNNRMLISDDSNHVRLDDKLVIKTQDDFMMDDGTGNMVEDTAAFKVYNDYVTAFQKTRAEDETPLTKEEFIKNGKGNDNAYAAYQEALNYVQTYKDAEKLLQYNNEKAFVDVGMGLEETPDGTLLEASGFNSSLSGLQYLGFGVDEDGDSKNVALLTRQLGTMFHETDPDSGAMTAEEKKEAERLFDKLGDAVDNCITQHVDLASKCEYLEDNQTRLKTTHQTLNEELEGTERVDGADAITEMMYASYCYNASLKIGNSVLSQSLLDYMN